MHSKMVALTTIYINSDEVAALERLCSRTM